MNRVVFLNILFVLLFFSSCTVVRKVEEGKPYILKASSLEIKDSKFSKEENTDLSKAITKFLTDLNIPNK